MENLKLELTQQNGEKSELIPLSFKYTIEDFSQMEFNLCSVSIIYAKN